MRLADGVADATQGAGLLSGPAALRGCLEGLLASLALEEEAAEAQAVAEADAADDRTTGRRRRRRRWW